MTVTHRTFEGAWAVCRWPATCQLRFHFEDRTPEMMAAMPLPLLLPVLTVMDPPTVRRAYNTGELLCWQDRGGVLHRAYDLPATIYLNTAMAWFQHGRRHRWAGPAIIEADGSEFWYVDGQLHREHGPAITHADGRQEWFRRDQPYVP